MEKRNLKLAESLFNSIKNCNGITCNKQKQFLISCKMAVSFKLKNFDSPLYLFLLYLNVFPLFLLRYHLPLHIGLLVMLVLFPKNLFLILPTCVMVLFVQVMSIVVNLFVLVNLFVQEIPVPVNLFKWCLSKLKWCYSKWTSSWKWCLLK